MFTKTSRNFLVGLIALTLAGPLAGWTVTEAGEEGLAAFNAQKCNMCHSVPQAEIVAKMKSEKMKGPDLPAEARESDWIMGFLKREVQVNGADHKKEYKGTDEELQAIAAWLIELKGAE
jgi:mono/diheme cytochrome c family protein